MGSGYKNYGSGKKYGCFVLLFFLGIIIFLIIVVIPFGGHTEPYIGWRSLDEMMEALGNKYEYPSYLPDSVRRDYGAFHSGIGHRVLPGEWYLANFWKNEDFDNREVDAFIMLPQIVGVNCREYTTTVNDKNNIHEEHNSLREHRELYVGNKLYQVDFYFNVSGRGSAGGYFAWSLGAVYTYVKNDFEYNISTSYGNIVYFDTSEEEEEIYELFLLHKDAAIDHLGNELIKIAESMKPASEILR